MRSLNVAAKPYAGAEKVGIHIVMSTPNIVDVELVFMIAGVKEGNAGNSRVDFAAVHEMADEARLAFYEAKRFSNPETRASRDAPPRVVEQISRYASLLRQHGWQVEILQAGIFELAGGEGHRWSPSRTRCGAVEGGQRGEALGDLRPPPAGPFRIRRRPEAVSGLGQAQGQARGSVGSGPGSAPRQQRRVHHRDLAL